VMQAAGYLRDGGLGRQVHCRRRERRHAAGISLHVTASGLLLDWITEGERSEVRMCRHSASRCDGSRSQHGNTAGSANCIVLKLCGSLECS
jgi:hypothetical protein